MQGDTALGVFERCKPQIITLLFKLQKQLDYYCDINELISEAQERWVTCFRTIYEEDKQFLRYMFVVMKNRIKDLKRDRWRYQRTHISDPMKICAGIEEPDGHVRVWNEMAVDHKEESAPIRVELNELISRIEDKLSKKFHKDVFKMLVEGYPHKKIAEELGCSVGHVAKTKKDFIWPVTQQVMNISEDKYEVLTDSGRIYS